MTKPAAPPPAKDPRPSVPPAEPVPKAVTEGVRRQRRHIQELTGEDPLRGGVAD